MASSPSPSNKSIFQQGPVLIAILVGLSAALAAGYFLVLRKDYVVLYDDLRTAEASAVVAELDRQGVDYRLARGGSQILVLEPEHDAVRLSVAAAELPVQGLSGFELFDESDMGLTDFAQKIKYQRALQGELSRTIMAMEGVTEARVHLSIPERSLFRGETSRAKAAVTLTTRGAEFETAGHIEGVQQLVAAAVADLAAAEVVVLNARGELVSPRPPVAAGPVHAQSKDEAALSDALRAALPGSRAEVLIDASSANVSITTAAALPPEDQAIARREVSSTIGGAFATPATIVFKIAPALTPPVPMSIAATLPRAPAPEVGREPAPDASESWRTGILVALALIALSALGFVLLVTRKKPATALLSLEDQKQFADRLKLGLQSQARERHADAA